MVVQHNIPAMNANRYFGINNSGLSKSLEKLSSGYAINRAGDNAAGLAVSEKMRSQIAGLTQGVKNAQDGISMVQTYEGALTETDSILQRMKTLADQAANGTYQDDVDRDAIQLEFDQLNDELNQIADTDFNGVVVLNGGVMSDGLEQVDGKFDYSLKAGQVAEKNAAKLAAAQKEAQAKIDDAQKAYDAALNKSNAIGNRDLCLDGTAPKWNTVDNSQYGKDDATLLFSGIDIDGHAVTPSATSPDADSLAAKGIESIEVTYKYTSAADNGGTAKWEIAGGTFVNDKGETVEIDAAAITATISKIEATDNGGFIAGVTATAPTAGSSANATYGNAVLASSDIKTGDVVTLTYTNSSAPVLAPTNIGIDHDSLVNKDKIGGDAVPTLTLDAGITADNLTEETVNALEKLDKAEISFDYSASGINASISDKDLLIAATATAGTYQISYKDHNGDEVKLATVTTVESNPASTGKIATGKGSQKDTNTSTTAVAATSTTFTYDGTKWDDGAGNATVTIGNITFDTATDIAGNAVKGDTITVSTTGITAKAGGVNGEGTVTAVYNGVKASVGTIKFGVALDEGKWNSSGTVPTINPSTTSDNSISTSYVEIDKAFEDAKAALDEAKAAYPKTVDDLPDDGKVSVSDALDNATAPLTYTDHVMLQAGARSKDLVDFTFKYSTGGMGDLKANMNCSAREDGLNTANLSLKTQADANYAIDRIDNAINKVSMVRATFGAVQNRLEHKIDNMNVTKENMTSAESRIRDTNMAEEMTNFTKNQILSQASQAMLAQANQLPQGVLQLLG